MLLELLSLHALYLYFQSFFADTCNPCTWKYSLPPTSAFQTNSKMVLLLSCTAHHHLTLSYNDTYLYINVKWDKWDNHKWEVEFLHFKYKNGAPQFGTQGMFPTCPSLVMPLAQSSCGESSWCEVCEDIDWVNSLQIHSVRMARSSHLIECLLNPHLIDVIDE